MRMVILFSLLLACAKPHKSYFSVEPEFIQYVQQFEQESYAQKKPLVINDIIIKFDDDFPNGVVGYCFVQSNKTPIITINRHTWPYLSAVERKVLLFHELAHCVLRLEHDDSSITINRHSIPKSIMNSYLLSDSVYLEFEDYYMKELFQQALIW